MDINDLPDDSTTQPPAEEDKPKPIVQRDAKGRLLKGSKLNPAGGHPFSKRLQYMAAIQKQAKPEKAAELVKIALEIAEDTNAKNNERLKAIELVLKHTVGNPEYALAALQHKDPASQFTFNFIEVSNATAEHFTKRVENFAEME